MRFFITPAQQRYRGIGDKCWRCGGDGANHFHIFWDFKVIRQYWSVIHDHLQNVFSFVFPSTFETIFLCNVPVDKLNSNDRRLLYILLAASKKPLTRRWLNPEPPTMEDWIHSVQEIYAMEKVAYSIKLQTDDFYGIWSKWMDYVKHMRCDFVQDITTLSTI